MSRRQALRVLEGWMREAREVGDFERLWRLVALFGALGGSMVGAKGERSWMGR